MVFVLIWGMEACILLLIIVCKMGPEELREDQILNENKAMIRFQWSLEWLLKHVTLQRERKMSELLLTVHLSGRHGENRN
jgi:hypothetical protein